MSLPFAVLAALAIIYVVPFVVYGAANALGWVKLPPEASPQKFLLGVLVSKIGTAVAFVVLLRLGGEAWAGRWLLYALVWFAMFAATELGDAIAGRSTWPEAGLGVLSEAIYAPTTAFAAHEILGLG